MENQIDTVADLVRAIIAQMERLNYKPSVIKQYHDSRLERYAKSRPLLLLRSGVSTRRDLSLPVVRRERFGPCWTSATSRSKRWPE